MRAYLWVFMVVLGAFGFAVGTMLPLVPSWMEAYHDRDFNNAVIQEEMRR
jgi:hypothetical protein